MLKVRPQADIPTPREKTLIDRIRKQALRIEELEGRVKALSAGSAVSFGASEDEIAQLKHSHSDLVCRLHGLETQLASRKTAFEALNQKHGLLVALIERLSLFVRGLGREVLEQKDSRNASAESARWVGLSAALALVPFQGLDQSVGEIGRSLRAIAGLLAAETVALSPRPPSVRKVSPGMAKHTRPPASPFALKG